jgi:hypothetical protein
MHHMLEVTNKTARTERSLAWLQRSLGYASWEEFRPEWDALSRADQAFFIALAWKS